MSLTGALVLVGKKYKCRYVDKCRVTRFVRVIILSFTFEGIILTQPSSNYLF